MPNTAIRNCKVGDGAVGAGTDPENPRNPKVLKVSGFGVSGFRGFGVSGFRGLGFRA